jgi:Cdc6-like AAA superfamily ATPase
MTARLTVAADSKNVLRNGLPEDFFKSLLHIHLPWTQRVLEAAEATLESAMLSGEGGILVIVGPPGCGKSHLTRQCLKHLRQIWTPREFERFAVEIDAESCGNRKDFAAAVVTELKDAALTKGSVDWSGKDFSRYLLSNAKDMRLRVVASHESHNLRLHGKQKGAEELASHIKNTINRGVSYIFNGLPELAAAINSHVELKSRLGAEIFKIPTMRPGNIKDTKALKVLMEGIEEALPVVFQPPLSSPQILLPLMIASGGVLRPMMKLIHYAVNRALSKGSSVVAMKDFRAASLTLLGDTATELFSSSDEAHLERLLANTNRR